MKRIIQCLLGMCLLMALHPSPAWATIEHISGEEVCLAGCSKDVEFPIRQGQTTTVRVQGQYVDLSTGLEVSGSGVTVSSAGASSSNKSIGIVVASNAEPGLRTIKLHYLVELNGPDTFNIRVVRKGRITGVEVPSPTQFFTDVNITFTGVNIGNARLFGSGTRVAPSGYNALNSSATLIENTDTRAVVHVHFDGDPLAEASAWIELFDKSCGALCEGVSKFNYNDSRDYSILGPNAIKTISFPKGSTVSPGDLLTVKVTLLRPVRSPNKLNLGTALGPLQKEQMLFWQLDPPAAFETAPRSGILYNSSGQNQIPISAGTDSVLLIVRVLPTNPCGASSPYGCPADVRVSLGSANAQYPASQTAPFTIGSN
jgi:hypothetical protein